MRVKIFMFICVSFVAAFLFNPQFAEAHRMLIEEVDEDTLHVRYDDGTDAGMANVSVFDESGELLTEGETDDKGLFRYDDDNGAYRFVADDGMGHRATLVPENDNDWVEAVPLSIRALLGVSFCLFIAAIFYRRHQVKK